MLNPSLRRRELIALLGGGMAWPLPGRAREAAKVPTIGVLWHAGSPDEEQPFFDALKKGFSELGYVEGQNIRLEHRFPNEIPDRFRSMIADLVAMNVDVIVSVAPASNWVRDANVPMPHVFVIVPDPVGSKFVESLSHPGGNATGLSMLGVDLTKKRLQFLVDCVPTMKSLGYLAPQLPVAPANLPMIKLTQSAASELGLDFKVFQAATLSELPGVLDAMVTAGVQGVSVAPSGLFYQGKATIAALASARKLPTCWWARELMVPGALLAYGPSLASIVRRAPIYVDKILKGAKPSDLPVEQPTKFELLINLGVAKGLGIEVPQMLLAQADEVTD
jgi:putative ABC transport system substrate-binding protein